MTMFHGKAVRQCEKDTIIERTSMWSSWTSLTGDTAPSHIPGGIEGSEL